MPVEMPTIGNQSSPGTTETPPTTPAEPSTPSTTEPKPEPTIVQPHEFNSGKDIDEAVLDMLALQEKEDEDGPGEPDPAPVVAPPPSEAPPPVEAAPVEAPAPATPVEATPPVVAPVPPVPEPTPVTQPAVAKPPEVQGQPVAPKETPAAEPEGKVPKPGEFAELAQAVQQQRTALESSLADMYAPNEKQMEEFHTEPQKVLGKLAARLHMEIVQNTLGVLAQNIPSAVNGVIEARTLHDGYETAFYKQWPQLNKNDSAQKNVVMQIARSYAHTNPSADNATRMRQIGAQAMVALNLLPAAPAAPAAAVPVAPPPAFAPAGQAAAATPQVAPTQLKGWEAIDASFEDSEA